MTKEARTGVAGGEPSRSQGPQGPQGRHGRRVQRRRRGQGERRPTLTDRGLVLRRHAYGESSLVLSAFTHRHGKIDVLAKGAYRPRSRTFGVLDYFDTLELSWKPGPHGGLGLVTEASITERRARLTRDLQRFHAGLGILELLGLVPAGPEPDPDLFRSAAAHLDVLQRTETAPALVVLAHDLAFLRGLGLAPALAHCAACGKRESARGDTVAFAPGAGGRLCTGCAREARAHGRRVHTLALNLARIGESLLRSDPGSLERTRLSPGPFNGVRSLVEGFLQYHLERRPRRKLPAFP